MASADIQAEEADKLFKKQARREFEAVLNTSFGIVAGSYCVEKIIRRAEANLMIKKIEEKGEAHGIDLIMSEYPTRKTMFNLH